jgi:hypothetical protein
MKPASVAKFKTDAVKLALQEWVGEICDEPQEHRESGRLRKEVLLDEGGVPPLYDGEVLV